MIKILEANLKNTNEGLDKLFGDDYSKYLEKPSIVASYYNPIQNETGEITKHRNTILWMGSIVANRYKIYRRKISESSPELTNDEWTETHYDITTQTNEEDEMVLTEYNDEDVQTNSIYIYRVVAQDSKETPYAWTFTDTVLNETTSSPQSDIIGNEYTTQKADDNFVELDEEVRGMNVYYNTRSRRFMPVNSSSKNRIEFPKPQRRNDVLIEIVGSVYIP